MQHSTFFLGFFIFSFFGTLHSQNEIQLEYRKFGTNDYYKHVVGSGSGSGMTLYQDYIDNKRIILDKVRQIESAIALEPISINLVFHLLYTDDQELAKQQLQSQMEALNRDFGGHSHIDKHVNDPSGKYVSLSTSPNIQFILAQTESSDRLGDGISIIQKSPITWKNWDDMKYSDYGGSAGTSQSKIINIWVCDLPKGLSSFASRPWLSTEADGIVIDQRYFGQNEDPSNPYNEGKTLTHLIANYLGLDDLWGSEGYCSDDGIEDTPIHNSANRGKPKYEHISICPQNLGKAEMVMNFMDSTDDVIQTMFTRGQVQRMRAILAITRTGLLSNTSAQ